MPDFCFHSKTYWLVGVVVVTWRALCRIPYPGFLFVRAARHMSISPFLYMESKQNLQSRAILEVCCRDPDVGEEVKAHANAFGIPFQQNSLNYLAPERSKYYHPELDFGL
jgi:hypothetical protein